MASSYLNYEDLNALGEFAVIAGSDLTLELVAYDELGVPYNLSGATCDLVISTYGKETLVLTLSGTVTGTNTVEFELVNTDTINLDGKYAYQPVIQKSGKTYRPQQGVIYFVSAIA